MRFSGLTIPLALLLGLVSPALVACSGGSDATGSGPGGTGGAGGAGPPSYTPTPLDPLEDADLTTEVTLVPVRERRSDDSLDPRVVETMNQMLADRYGDTREGPPLAVVDATLDDGPTPVPGPNAKLLTRFMHLADIQLADDESPARLASFDASELTQSAFRPQEGHECRILNAAVRTINALHKKSPIEFVVLGGDNADNAQANEIDWVMAILGGKDKVECDSGADNDPLAGGDNDPKDPFVAEGLDVPWMWVTGNHDVLNQGNFPAVARNAAAIGASAPSGTRNWAKPGGPVEKGEVVPDERREELSREKLLQKIAADGDGHGITQDVVRYGKAYYTFDPAEELRIVVLDTAAETGGSDGVIHRADLDDFIRPALDDARDAGKIVILTSHHISFGLSDGSGFGGTTQDDALTVEEWMEFVGGYDNVILHLAGHTHMHRVTKGEPPGGHAFWELETAALADFPNQMRLIEIWDQDNGFLSIKAIGVNYRTDGDDVAADGRKRGVVDYTSAWGEDGSGDPAQRNVNLWIAKP
jgi:3',5'-cyclic AMP phosphodiesterase CpdA